MNTPTIATDWLAADYSFASVYSCRVPLSSMSSARAMPAPGPATVRLALLRTGIELFGEAITRDMLFPIIRSMPIHVRPPKQVAFSNQIIRAYKASSPDGVEQAPIYREVAHAIGPMTIYLKAPKRHQSIYRELLMAIGYWGTADSLACCEAVYRAVPVTAECSMPLGRFVPSNAMRMLFTCLAAEFSNERIEWRDVIPAIGRNQRDVIRIEVYVWPMIILDRHSAGVTLSRSSLK